MRKFKAIVHIRLKSGILDPQGQAISHALQALGFESLDSVRAGKLIELTLAAENEANARSQVARACERLLANPVIEEYEITLTEL